MRIAETPFPFPYTQVCDTVLMLHWMLLPLVTSVWVTNPVWAATFCFIQVFILWSLTFTAVEIENPFGQDANDISGRELQDGFNKKLRLLVSQSTRRTPKLSRAFKVSAERISQELAIVTDELDREFSRTLQPSSTTSSFQSMPEDLSFQAFSSIAQGLVNPEPDDNRSTSNSNDGDAHGGDYMPD